MKKNYFWSTLIAILATLAILASISLLAAGCGQEGQAGEANQEFHQLLLDQAVAEDTCPDPAIYDQYGTAQTVAWMHGRYGPNLTWECEDPHPDADYVFRLTELRESCGPAIFIINVKDKDGAPLGSKAVIRYWPGAPALPYYDPPASRHTDLGIYGFTSANGDVGFGVGGGDAYFPETGSGVTELYIADYDGPSDWLKGIGWLAGTEHCTMFSVFTRLPKDDIVPPTPVPTDTPVPGTPIPAPEGLLEIEKIYIKLATPVPTP